MKLGALNICVEKHHTLGIYTSNRVKIKLTGEKEG
jgi:hypothetical protein